MVWTKKMAQEHIYIFSFMLALTAIGILYVGNFIIFKSNMGLDYNFNRILAHLIASIFVVFICISLGFSNRVRVHLKGIAVGILFGWVFIIDGIYGFVASYISFDKSSIFFPSMQKILYFTLVMFLVGVFEEFLIRGTILNNMIQKWGNSKAGIIKAVVISSLIFSLGHLSNLLANQPLVTTLTQVIYTFLNGILFASIYLRSKNIWAVVILHAIYDWLCLVSDIYHIAPTSTASVDTSILSMFITSMLYIPFALYGFFLLRKVAVEDTKIDD